MWRRAWQRGSSPDLRMAWQRVSRGVPGGRGGGRGGPGVGSRGGSRGGSQGVPDFADGFRQRGGRRGQRGSRPAGGGGGFGAAAIWVTGRMPPSSETGTLKLVIFRPLVSIDQAAIAPVVLR